MKKNKILLHTCCAPCLVYVHEKLVDLDEDFDVYYYNPNIHPIQEHKRRKETLQKYCEDNSLDLLINEEFLQQLWEEGMLCEHCYKIRLENTAKKAVELGYGAFSSTLLVSIYQDHEALISIGRQLEKQYGIKFFYHDFREGFRKGQNKARELGMYRQKYCGCINSYNASKFKDKITWE